MVNLAKTWHEQGKLDEAESLLSQAVELRRQVLGVEHPYTIGALKDLEWMTADRGARECRDMGTNERTEEDRYDHRADRGAR